MRDELAAVLRLVAEGRISPEEAAPIIEALSAPPPRQVADAPSADHAHAGGRPGSQPGDVHASRRRVRIQVSERGRRVVDLHVPLAFAAAAARSLPGIPHNYAAMIEQAVAGEGSGTIIDAEDEDGSGVLISIE